MSTSWSVVVLAASRESPWRDTDLVLATPVTGWVSPVEPESGAVLAVSPPYDVEERELLGHFTQKGLTSSLIKTLLFKSIALVGRPPRGPDGKVDLRKQPRALANRVGELRGHEVRATKLALKKVSEGVAKDMGKTMVRKFMENIIIANLDARVAVKFVKSVKQSARRKAERSGRLIASLTIFKTSFLACCLEHTAIFATEVGVNAFIVLYRKARKMWKPDADKPDVRGDATDAKTPEILRRTPLAELPKYADMFTRTATQCSASIAAEALGASIGTLLLPGTGTVVGSLIGGTVCYLIL